MALSYLTGINLNQNELLNARVQNLAVDPASPVLGQIYFNTTTNKFRVFNGTSWEEMDSGSVTSVGLENAAGENDFTITGSPITQSGSIAIKHSNTITPKTTSGIYPVKIDKHGHITETGTALGNVSTTADGTLPAFKAASQDSTKVASGDYLWDATAGKYRQLPPTAFSDTTYEDGTTGFTLKAKQDGNGKQIDTTYAPIASPGLTGIPTAPTAAAGTNTTQIATTAFVSTAISGVSGAMHFKGTVGTGGTVTDLPTTGVKIGDTYKVCSAGTYASQAAKVGDLFIATATTPTWAYVPSGDETGVTSITAGTGLTGGTITSTGTIALAESGVTAGTYQGLTVDAYGRVTAAVNKGYLTRFVQTLTGDASKTEFTVTHNLGTRDVTVQVYDASTYEDVMVDIARTSTSAVTISFASAPTSGKEYRVVVTG